jgi:hypothetical protein
MAGPQLPFTETLQNPLSFLGVDTKPAQPTNRLEKEAADLGAREEQFLKSNIDLTRDLGKMMLKDAEGKNLLAIKEKELEAKHDRERKRIRDYLGEQFYNSLDMQEFKKFADESADKMMFVPSQTTAPLLGVVFATIGATGLLLGGLSKGNAKAALSAMNGMAEGFAKGKEDLYKQERQTFDTNVKAMTQRMGILKSKLDVAREKMKYDAEAADLEANAAFAEAGADFLKANKDKFGLQDSIIKLETQIKQNDTWARLMETKKSAAIKESEAQRFKAHESELNRNQQTSIQTMLETGREERAAESIAAANARAASDRKMRALIAQMGQQGVQPIGMADGQLMVMDKSGNISSRPLPEGFKGAGKLAPSAKSSGSGSGSGGTVQFRYNSAMVNAGNQLAIEVANAADLPALSAPPVAAEVLTNPSKGLTDAGRAFFSQKITQPEARAMQQVLAGMQRAMTTIETSGRPSGATESAIKEFGKTLPRAGDNKINTYLFLAQTRQVMEILEKDLKAAGASDEQIKQAIAARKEVENVVSWTVKDVNRILSKDGARLVDDRTRDLMKNSQTLGEFNSELRKKPSEGTPSSAPRGTGTPEDPIRLD